MKNLFLIFTCLFFTISLAAQADFQRPGSNMNEQDRTVKQLANQINTIAYSNMNPDHKQARIMGILGSYLSKYNSVTVKYPVSDPGRMGRTAQKADMGRIVETADKATTAVKNTTTVKGSSYYGDCDSKKVRAYLEDFRRHQFLHIPAKYLAQLGNVKTDCALAKAVEIYNSVGYEYLSSANICEIIGCNTDDRMRQAPQSRGAGVWQYTGVKRFFTEEDDFGWRYLCEFVIPTDDRTQETEDGGLTSGDLLDQSIRTMENADPSQMTKGDAKGGDSKGDAVQLPGLDTNNAQWRTQEEVDRW